MNRRISQALRFGVMGILVLTLFTVGSITAFAHGQHDQDNDNYAVAVLKHTPHGWARLEWEPKTEALTVTIKLTGLQANSRHPAHIHLGNCLQDNGIAYMLNDVVADATGNAKSTTVINNVEGGIAATGWFINVHTGPTLATMAEMTPITCGNITQPHLPKNEKQSVRIVLDGANAPNQNAFGFSVLSLHHETLTVKTFVFNLAPGSEHMIHIHAGSCDNQIPGKVVYPLTMLKADANGFATSTTVIKDVGSIPESGWYINVHNGTDLSTQAGFDPIDCGNVKV